MTSPSNQMLRRLQLVLLALAIVLLLSLFTFLFSDAVPLQLMSVAPEEIAVPSVYSLGIVLGAFSILALLVILVWVYLDTQRKSHQKAMLLAEHLTSQSQIDTDSINRHDAELLQLILPQVLQQQAQIKALSEENELFASALDEINDMGKQLRISERRWTLALAATGDGIWEWDASKNGWYFSQRWKAMLGYADNEVPNHRDAWQQLVHADDLNRISVLFAHFIQVKLVGAQPVFEAEFRMRHRDGDWRQILSRAVADRDHQGRVVRVVGAHSDVSEQRRIVSELSCAKEAAEQAVEKLRGAQLKMLESEKLAALGALVAGVAHEVNTPLGIALTAASTLADDTHLLGQMMDDGRLKKTELQHYLHVAQDASALIFRHCDNAANLIRSFKNISVDQTAEVVRDFDLGRYLQEILLSLRPSLKQTAHQIALSCPEDLLVRTYPSAFTQIISNLVNNAILHAFVAGQAGLMQIQISLQGSQFVELRFTDNGVGIAPGTRAKVFEPFYTTKRGQGGSGLGMSIVHNLVVAQLQGAISIEETPGGGASFIIVFPRAL